MAEKGQQVGRLKAWNDERGFGFIEPARGGDDIFVHIKSFRDRSRRPVVNQILKFEIESGKDGKLRAVNVMPGSVVRQSRSRPQMTFSTGGLQRLVVIPIYFALCFAPPAKLFPAAWSGCMLILSVISFCTYWSDKAAALNDDRRVPEAVLLLLSLFGGWPGALLAQHMLRHKTSKESFQASFWLIVILHFVILIALIAEQKLQWIKFVTAGVN